MSKLFIYIKENYILVSVLLMASFLRVYHIDFQSLWIDEINTMVEAKPMVTFAETYRSLSMDLQPPLYFYVLKYLFKVFGYTTLVLRLFSAALGIAGVLGVYLLGKELYNKKTGIYATLILGVNYFHIYYSQEARPYTFLFLFTTLAFYQLVKFIKSPSYKSALFYGIASCLMLYGHPYGLFSLFSQYLILLISLMQMKDRTRWLFFKQAFLSGVICMFLYIPALQLFMSAANIKSFWIPLPGPDVYTHLLGEFFGKSETIISLVYLLAVFFFIKVFSTEDETNFLEGLRTNKLSSVFVLLAIWLLIGLLFPLIRSYLQVPMIVPRYLIGLLPAVVIIVSIGLYRIRHILIRSFLIVLIVIFSVTDIFIIKDYYNKVTKSQLREITEFIKQNNNGGVIIVSDLWWHYPFFLDPKKYTVPEISPVDFVKSMMSDPNKIKPFWYSSGHHFTYQNLPDSERNFLRDNFYIAQKLDLIEAWAIHFIPKQGEGQLNLNMSEFTPLNAGSGNYIFLYNNSSTRSKQFALPKGNYTMYIEGRSEPEHSINGINAHLTVKLNDRVIGGVFLPDNKYPAIKQMPFSTTESGEQSVEFIFDNDLMFDHRDRNALIYSVRIEYASNAFNK